MRNLLEAVMEEVRYNYEDHLEMPNQNLFSELYRLKDNYKFINDWVKETESNDDSLDGKVLK